MDAPSFLKKHYILIIILSVASLLRVVGIYFGYPYALNFDEMQDIPNALNMLQNVHLKPPHYIHGSFYFYFYEFFALVFFLGGKSLGAYKNAWDINPIDLIIFCRFISAAIGTITVYFTYLVGKRLYSNTIGIIAAALLATNFLHVMVSHYATQDALLTLIVLITFYLAIKAYHRDRLSSYITLGISCGVATATSMIGIISIVWVFFIVYHHGKHLALKKLLYAGSASLVTFLLLSPYFILDFATYFADVKYTIDFYNTGENAEFASDLNGIPTWLWWGKYLTSIGLLWPLSLTVLVGTVYLIKKPSTDTFLLLSYPILCTIILLGHSVRYDRNVTHLLPFITLISAITIIKFIKHMGLWAPRKWINNCFIAFLWSAYFIYPLFMASAFAYEILKEDTSLRATQWIESNVKENETIAIITSRGTESYSMPFNRLVGPYQVLFTQIHFKDFVSNPDIYQNVGIQYLVIGSDYANQSIFYRSVYGDQKYEFFNNLKNRFKLVAKIKNPLFHDEFFSPHSLERSATVNFNHHRTYEIYSLKDATRNGINKKKNPYTKSIETTFSPSRLIKHSHAQLIENPGSKFGKTVLGGGDAEKFVVWGPYENIPVGDYEITFSLRVNQCNDDKPVAEISVQPGGKIRPYSKKTIECHDFHGLNSFKKFKLAFHNPPDISWIHQIETPIKSLMNGVIEIEYIEIKGKGLDF